MLGWEADMVERSLVGGRRGMMYRIAAVGRVMGHSLCRKGMR